MKVLLLIVPLFTLSYGNPLVNHEDELRWAQRQQLVFSDFKGEVPKNTPWAALTASYIYFTYSTSNGKISSVKVYASFKKMESWMKTERADVLEHEQLHFAITEIFARKLYADSQSLKEKTGNVPAAASEIFKSINEDCDRMQEDYDKETAHGTKAEEQANWKRKVEKLLTEFEPYPVTNE